MAGYSGTPLAKKLGIKPGHLVALINSPAGFNATLAALAADAFFSTDLAAEPGFNVLICFVSDSKQLRTHFLKCVKRLLPDGGLWVGWPKQASGVATDLTENSVRDVGLAAGLVDNKVCAIDETWSGLRFVVRVKDRPKQRK
jgi:hypothetical protein